MANLFNIKEEWTDLLVIFKVEVFDNAKRITNPEGDALPVDDWYSMTVGWAMGKKMDPEDAHEFAMYVKYRTEMDV